MKVIDIEDRVRARQLPPPSVHRALRVAAGLSQREVGELVGVGPWAVSRWESGERSPRGTRAIAYARLLRELARALGGDA